MMMMMLKKQRWISVLSFSFSSFIHLSLCASLNNSHIIKTECELKKKEGKEEEKMEGQ